MKQQHFSNYETQMRLAFADALEATTERTKVTGKVFRALKSTAGVRPFTGFRHCSWAKAFHYTHGG